MTIDQRAENSAYMFYAKATNKEDVTTSILGQSYTVEWTSECNPLKQPRGILPLTFKMRNMGAPDPDHIPCGPRNVIGGFNYVFFAMPDPNEPGYWILDEVNNQTALFRPDEHPVELAPWLLECLNNCHSDVNPAEDNWEVMSLSDRINAAEYAFEVHMTTQSEGCVQCVLKEPTNPGINERIFGVNETIEVVSHSATCFDYGQIVEPNKRYITLLERVEISGRPDAGNHLSPDEVNGQQAIYELNEQILAELGDMLAFCPAEDYMCPTEPSPTPDSSRVLEMSVLVLLGLFFA